MNNENEIRVCLRSAYTVSSVHCQCVPLLTITLSVFMFKHEFLCHTLHPSHSNICSFNEATDVLTNTPPSTCRCFWGSQEAEAGSILFLKLLGPVPEKEGAVALLPLHVGDMLCGHFLIRFSSLLALGHARIKQHVQETTSSYFCSAF